MGAEGVVAVARKDQHPVLDIEDLPQLGIGEVGATRWEICRGDGRLMARSERK
jgi:hypothetical protein